MNKKFSFLTTWLIILSSCKTDILPSIVNGSYKGYAIAYYHIPISGNMVEVIIIPVAGDTSSLRTSVEYSISKVRSRMGVSTILNLHSYFFQEISRKSKKITLVNNPTLAKEYQSIYSSCVYIDFTNANNNTKYVIGSSDTTLQESFVLKNNYHTVLTYFLSDSIKINYLRSL